MLNLPLQTPETAPEASRPIMEKVARKYGFLPNMLAGLANSPTALEAYVSLAALLDRSRFTPEERQLLFLVMSKENGCDYCEAAHSTVLGSLKANPESVEAIRDGRLPESPKHKALVRFGLEVIQKRGHVSEETIEAFREAGYDDAQALDVLVAGAAKLITNYYDHYAPIPVDPAFKGQMREKAQA